MPRLPAVLTALVAGGIALHGVAVAAPWAIPDDAYMYARYADHLLQTGVVAWQPGGPPAFGATSPLFLLIVTALRAVLRGDPLVPLVIASALCGVACALAAVAMVRRLAAEAGWPAWPTVAAVALALVPQEEWLGVHVASGMDTMLALLAVTVLLMAAMRYERQRTRAAMGGMALAGALAVLVRADLAVFAVGLPVAFVCWPEVTGDRRRGVEGVGLLAALFALILVAQWHWLGSPLPLPLWAKVGHPYGADFDAHYAYAAASSLRAFVLENGVSLATAAVVVVAGPWYLWCSAGALWRGVAACVVGFAAFYASVVTPIMDYQARFYQPVLPALIFVGLRAARHAASRLDLGRWRVPDGAEARLRGMAMVAGTVIAIGAFGDGLVPVLIRPQVERAVAAIAPGPDTPCWMRPREVPTGATYASTEVGLLASQADRVVHDMAGINSVEFLSAPLDVGLTQRLAPDAIMEVNADYGAAIARFMDDEAFRRTYDVVLNTDKGFTALRRDSPYYGVLSRPGRCGGAQ